MERTIKHICMFSTGLSSAYLADWLIREQGRGNVMLFMTDTLWEDEDNYRFAGEVSRYLDMPLTIVKDGRTPEEVFFDERFMGNFGTAPCSKELKMKQTVIFVEHLRSEGFEPILYFGIGKDEKQRAPRIAYNYSHNCLEPVECRFPLTKLALNNDILTDIIQGQWGIRRPRMYDYGFHHANCGGRCIKGGVGHYTLLYKIWPERYKDQEEMERKFRAEISDYTILRRNNEPFSLAQLREEIERNGYQQDFVINSEVEMPCTCVF